MRILMLAAEVAPFAKVGGLADVTGSLPKALMALGHEVRIMMPRYRTIPTDHLAVVLPSFPVMAGLGDQPAKLLRGSLGDVPVYFIDNPYFFGDRPKIYGEEDEGEQFAYFCRAALDALRHLQWAPDILHAHDWHTAWAPLLLKESRDPFFAATRSVFTIHNLAYQGIFPRELLDFLRLPSRLFNPTEVEFHGNLNSMKAGILFSDEVNTVSERYALEIQTAEYGERLEGVLQNRHQHLRGILNGLDYAQWNPETDPHLSAHYRADDSRGKAECKRALQRELGLPEEDAPLFGLISRLVDQKGLDLLADVAETLLASGAQLVILGSGDARYEGYFRNLADLSPRCAVRIGFDAALADRIYAGSDFFLMPSKFEPCGLGQLISLRYGTLPIVRETGGLADTVHEGDNGWVFQDYTPTAFFAAIRRAEDTFRNRERFESMRKHAMQQDFSWSASALKYVEMYQAAKKH